ncbi:helix-turn-helix transcriptional regulator [Desulfosporosinus sp. BICA1-9]|uniref:ArsR/SmtB family transcription factor n=1 Tax=Desulfosporosinus sp. BICA1-9 TaxID=1531958 RepID=UPI00054B8CDF|nr:metalloregulator ArsR/SmtB family transcription factor [Desulfosporosinus sp. BICA1-9]KJS46180.1 MAG: ArsR family transcriptional regulator [Peptococcaceae bacterium BRH_c23]KJS90093.1 MAG: ArsR family transcriptional regulator [Desulfosporosinus sp. BICA1-9]HBW36332.1 ArsR family transcriptional regulator [Desulfosporosinus sp.]
MSTTPRLEEMVEGFKVLGDKTRLRILLLLQGRELCVCDLTEVFEISQPGVSQHMRRLRQTGFVNERRGGQWTYYSLNMRNPLIGLILPMFPKVEEDEERLTHVQGCKT